jgi:hypothetical protein
MATPSKGISAPIGIKFYSAREENQDQPEVTMPFILLNRSSDLDATVCSDKMRWVFALQR